MEGKKKQKTFYHPVGPSLAPFPAALTLTATPDSCLCSFTPRSNRSPMCRHHPSHTDKTFLRLQPSAGWSRLRVQPEPTPEALVVPASPPRLVHKGSNYKNYSERCSDACIFIPKAPWNKQANNT